MSGQSNPQEEKLRYILGNISEEEQARLEESYFVDDTEFEQFEIAEDELIDRYVRGELSQPESERLEKTLAMSPRLIERVQFARVMASRLAPESVPAAAVAATVEKRPPPGEKVSWWQGLFGFPTASRAPAMALSFSVLLLLAGGVTLLVAYLNLREQSRQLTAQQAALEQRQRELDKQAADLKAKNDELANQFQFPSPAPAPSQQPTPETAPRASILAFALSPGSTRSAGGRNSLRLQPETSEVQLTLNLRDTDYPSYRATVISDSGEVFSRSGLRPQVTRRGAVLTLRVPAKQLAAGDYYVSVHGVTPNGSESVDEYPFRVIK